MGSQNGTGAEQTLAGARGKRNRQIGKKNSQEVEHSFIRHQTPEVAEKADIWPIEKPEAGTGRMDGPGRQKPRRADLKPSWLDRHSPTTDAPTRSKVDLIKTKNPVGYSPTRSLFHRGFFKDFRGLNHAFGVSSKCSPPELRS